MREWGGLFGTEEAESVLWTQQFPRLRASLWPKPSLSYFVTLRAPDPMLPVFHVVWFHTSIMEVHKRLHVCHHRVCASARSL